MYFDARAAKLLQSGDHLVIDGCAGLRLVATQTGKTWTYRYKAQRQAVEVEAPAVYTVRKLLQDFKDGHLRQSRKPAEMRLGLGASPWDTSMFGGCLIPLVCKWRKLGSRANALQNSTRWVWLFPQGVAKGDIFAQAYLVLGAVSS